MADLSFVDFSDVVASSHDAVPADIYVARIVEDELKPTKSGSGQYLQVTWEIVEGKYARRKVFDRFNLVNDNKTAQNIGKAQYQKMCRALGFPEDQKTTEAMHNIPCRIKVVVKNDPQYGDSNDVKNYEPVANARPGANAPAPAAARPTSSAPWNRNKAA